MTDFIAHSNGTMIDVNRWDDVNIAEHYQELATAQRNPLAACDPEDFEEIMRNRREYEACKSIVR